MLIAGSFLTINDVVRPHVARLYGDAAAPSMKITWSSGLAVLSWPAAFGNYQFQKNTNPLLPDSWSPVEQPAATNGTQIFMPIPANAAHKLFRLKSQ